MGVEGKDRAKVLEAGRDWLLTLLVRLPKLPELRNLSALVI
jgi:hypothetical protein